MKLKIYNETWDVKEVEQTFFNEMDGKEYDAKDLTYGRSADAISTIYLLKTLGEQTKKAVLRHELGHAIVSMFQLANVELSEEYMVSFAAAHFAEIGNAVKLYFKPKKKRTRKPKEVLVDVL